MTALSSNQKTMPINESRSMPGSRRGSSNQNETSSNTPAMMNRNQSACMLNCGDNQTSLQQMNTLQPTINTTGMSLSTGHLAVRDRHGSFSAIGGLSEPELNQPTGNITKFTSTALQSQLGTDFNNNQLRRKSSFTLMPIRRTNRSMSLRTNSEQNENNAFVQLTQKSCSPNGYSSTIQEQSGESNNRINTSQSSWRKKKLSISANSCSSSEDMSTDEDHVHEAANNTNEIVPKEINPGSKKLGKVKLSFAMSKGFLEIMVIEASGPILDRYKYPPGE